MSTTTTMRWRKMRSTAADLNDVRLLESSWRRSRSATTYRSSLTRRPHISHQLVAHRSYSVWMKSTTRLSCMRQAVDKLHTLLTTTDGTYFSIYFRRRTFLAFGDSTYILYDGVVNKRWNVFTWVNKNLSSTDNTTLTYTKHYKICQVDKNPTSKRFVNVFCLKCLKIVKVCLTYCKNIKTPGHDKPTPMHAKCIKM